MTSFIEVLPIILFVIAGILTLVYGYMVSYQMPYSKFTINTVYILIYVFGIMSVLSTIFLW